MYGVAWVRCNRHDNTGSGAVSWKVHVRAEYGYPGEFGSATPGGVRCCGAKVGAYLLRCRWCQCVLCAVGCAGSMRTWRAALTSGKCFGIAENIYKSHW